MLLIAPAIHSKRSIGLLESWVIAIPAKRWPMIRNSSPKDTYNTQYMHRYFCTMSKCQCCLFSSVYVAWRRHIIWWMVWFWTIQFSSQFRKWSCFKHNCSTHISGTLLLLKTCIHYKLINKRVLITRYKSSNFFCLSAVCSKTILRDVYRQRITQSLWPTSSVTNYQQHRQYSNEHDRRQTWDKYRISAAAVGAAVATYLAYKCIGENPFQ